ncbi:D-alanine--D-alanine ligase family protein [Nannocystis bainbridge]|uniref:D-alanine--D-alanine ligase n=1 Tax=Nannocystis bainbridge TaxID=2995303 RepID=A0ABT5E141_9BACT|nr:D-alanine--D-alanine ligase family protein [Nannocystis bainbridge]MDC0719535.1 D-alanine--D-alanine ligase [Nannocystis bainbridge]
MPARRLLIVFGGRSSEHEISLRSAAEILKAIDHQRFTPVLLGIRRDGGWWTGPAEWSLEAVLESGEPVGDLRQLAPDLVFPVLHGPYGEDGTFQGLLEVLGLPYVGSGVLASALCMDKALLKHLLGTQAAAIPGVPWLEVDAHGLGTAGQRQEICDAIVEEVGFPCFVKPANQGSSVGISRVDEEAGLWRALTLAARYDAKLVVEKGIDAREIELAVLGNGDGHTLVSPPGEIGLPAGEWYDYENKYLKDAATLQIPADLPEATAERLRDLALRAFRVAGCKGLARIDFLVDRHTLQPYLNEINTMPGFTTISMYPKLIERAGVPYAELISQLCDLALAHHAARGKLSVTR